MRLARTAAAALVVAAAPAALAQGTAPSTVRTELTLFAGAGGVFPGSNPGLDRSTGAAIVGGAEVARPGRAGLLGRLALRLEGGFASQGFATGGVIDGDVQTVHGALALRIGLGRDAAAGRLAPYALAGAVAARPSTRVALREDPRATPGARFQQVTHETVPGALLGAGVAWRAWRAALRAEARWMTIATADRRTSSIPLVLTIAIPVGR